MNKDTQLKSKLADLEELVLVMRKEIQLYSNLSDKYANTSNMAISMHLNKMSDAMLSEFDRIEKSIAKLKEQEEGEE